MFNINDYIQEFEIPNRACYSCPMKQVSKNSGQVAIEYLLLLALMVIIALTAFRNLLPGAQVETNAAFNGAFASIVGEPAVNKTSVNGPWPFDDSQY